MRTDRVRYRFPPCPAYDLEGMENWLSGMAEKGLYLRQDGFFAGIASFEPGTPKETRYRLQASRKGTGMWSENEGEPDEEQLALGEQSHWVYTAKYQDFYIFRNDDPGAVELNTDPEVQALTLNAVKKRQTWNLIGLFLWLIVYPIAVVRGGLLTTMLALHTWIFLLTALLALWMVLDALQGVMALHRLQKQLRSTGSYSGIRRVRPAVYHGNRILEALLTIFLICIYLQRWGNTVMERDRIPLDAYTASLPFADLSDLAGEGSSGYRETMTGLSMGFNTVAEHTDWLASRILDYNEFAAICCADGRTLDGGWYVEYWEMRNPRLAAMLAKELNRTAKLRKGYEALEAPIETGDYLTAYRSDIHLDTIILQKENVVVRAFLLQSGEDRVLTFSQWAAMLYESII